MFIFERSEKKENEIQLTRIFRSNPVTGKTIQFFTEESQFEMDIDLTSDKELYKIIKKNSQERINI